MKEQIISLYEISRSLTLNKAALCIKRSQICGTPCCIGNLSSIICIPSYECLCCRYWNGACSSTRTNSTHMCGSNICARQLQIWEFQPNAINVIYVLSNLLLSTTRYIIHSSFSFYLPYWCLNRRISCCRRDIGPIRQRNYWPVDFATIFPAQSTFFVSPHNAASYHTGTVGPYHTGTVGPSSGVRWLGHEAEHLNPPTA
jgi:hypothetical protein